MEIRAYVAAQFDLKYSHSGCVKLLARLGFEYRKPKALPRVTDTAKQAEFIAMYENMLNSLADDEAVYFAPYRRFQANTCQAMDAVHPEYQSKPAFGWVKKGTNPTLKTMCGRPPHCKEYLAQSHPGRVQSCVRPIDAVFTS